MTMHRWLTRICLVLTFCVVTARISGGQTLTTLVTFEGTASDPHASLVQGTDGNFYGTTVTGGNTSCNPPLGCGTAFRVTQTGDLTILHRFCAQTNCGDGSGPLGGLVLGTDKNFYGTTFSGGAHNCTGSIECGGSVFEITSQGAFKTLYSFCSQTSCADGEFPYAELLIASSGNLYGTTSAGGAHGDGTIFKITPQGRLTTLYSFCTETSCRDGADPIGGLVRGTDGNLYGTTYGGGAYGYGTVFKLAPSGTLTTLYSFDSTDGANPTASLIQASNGRFYGSTLWGGTVLDVCPFGCGTLFGMSSNGTLATLESFDWSNGYEPSSAFVQATDNNLYATTTQGIGSGTIFKITLRGSLTLLYVFNGATDGGLPFGGLIQATNGTFYGTTAGGGAGSAGTVYSLDAGLGPFITFVLSTGKVGGTAQILGQGLTGATSATFNGVPATGFTAVSDTYMTAVVPSGATSGKVVVTTPSGTLTSNVNFRITK